MKMKKKEKVEGNPLPQVEAAVRLEDPQKDPKTDPKTQTLGKTDIKREVGLLEFEVEIDSKTTPKPLERSIYCLEGIEVD
ncbi:MAG: hypothetical protein GY940_30610 [bacterium]|nr:hypothetical protein [bacterium]